MLSSSNGLHHSAGQAKSAMSSGEPPSQGQGTGPGDRAGDQESEAPKAEY